MSSNEYTDITAEQAADLARRIDGERWRVAPGSRAPEDRIGNSYDQEEVGEGWIFTPTTSNIDRDPRLAATYDRYVVRRRDGETAAVPYVRGREAAEAYLART